MGFPGPHHKRRGYLNDQLDRMRFQFIKTALLIFASMVLLLAYPLHVWGSQEVINAVVASAIIAFLNAVAGAFSIEYAIDKSDNTFMIVIFGGMAVRVGLILAAMTVLLLNNYHPLALVFSLMGFYIVHMIAEIVRVVRELPRRKQASARTERSTFPSSHSVELWSN
jgi:hypothetical protein